jgi:hypothetical protein
MIVRETSRDAGLSGSRDKDNQNTTTRTRSFLVQADSPATSPNDVLAATGISLGDQLDGLTLTKFRVRPTDGVGMLWTVTAEYEPAVPEGGGGEEETPPGGVPGKPDIWSGSSSVTKKARYVDIFDKVMTNSAGDPFEEGCLADTAENRLTLTTYRRHHNDWLADSEKYTNSINADPWNGGERMTWKCQGCSKKLNIEQQDGGVLIYWEITWEFAYDPDTWTWKPWDIGFNETVNEDGEPTGYGTGEAAPGRRTIKGRDGKGVRNPVALSGGVAKAPGLPPDALEFNIYFVEDFNAKFGEVFTPGG